MVMKYRWEIDESALISNDPSFSILTKNDLIGVV